MELAERSREAVEARLAALEEAYDAFPVNQSTLSLSPDRYASLREEFARPTDAYIEVHNDDQGVLHVRTEGGAELPSVRAAPEDSLERRLRRAVRERTGVECVVDELDRVTIAGIRDAANPDAETLYHLVVVFLGTHRSGSPGERAEWRSTAAVEPAHA